MKPILTGVKMSGYWPIERIGKGNILQVQPWFMMDLLHNMSFVQAVEWIRNHSEDDLDIGMAEVRLLPETVVIVEGLEVTRQEFLQEVRQKRHRLVDLLLTFSPE